MDRPNDEKCTTTLRTPIVYKRELNIADPLPAADAVKTGESVLAHARAECVALDITPARFAEMLLPEALLALMVEGLDEQQARAMFTGFVEHEIGAWYARARVASERCDCAIEHATERHARVVQSVNATSGHDRDA